MEYFTVIDPPSDGERVIGVYDTHEERLRYTLVGPRSDVVQWLDDLHHDAMEPPRWRKIED